MVVLLPTPTPLPWSQHLLSDGRNIESLAMAYNERILHLIISLTSLSRML